MNRPKNARLLVALALTTVALGLAAGWALMERARALDAAAGEISR